MHSFQHSFDEYEYTKDCQYTYSHFKKAIKSVPGLWDRFISEYGESFTAKSDHLEGWTFKPNSVSLRECNLYPNHRDNHLWNFGKTDTLESEIMKALTDYGFMVGYNGGDEEDGLTQFKHTGLFVA